MRAPAVEARFIPNVLHKVCGARKLVQLRALFCRRRMAFESVMDLLGLLADNRTVTIIENVQVLIDRPEATCPRSSPHSALRWRLHADSCDSCDFSVLRFFSELRGADTSLLLHETGLGCHPFSRVSFGYGLTLTALFACIGAVSALGLGSFRIFFSFRRC
jgi:hypothetical protein